MDINYIEKNTDSLIEYFETIDSTNERAKKIAEDLKQKNNKINLVIAENQLAGKGTKGRVWLSNKGENILMTIIFYPENLLEELDGITYKIAEMIKHAIKDLYNISLDIKFPNDLLLNNKKVCGILTESSIMKNRVNYLLIGIGFNVNQVDFPEVLNEIATSLKKENLLDDYKREDIIIKIYNNIKSLIKNRI